ncbi:MAG: hypothetical protein CMJ75_18780 [Planctomycetaceae bacterium]|nr:hypothetical protein [Planctomycetaceae bacterium]
MQTFLPYAEYDRSAKALDPKRLANQVKEAAQIFASLFGGAYVLIPASAQAEHESDFSPAEPVLYSTGGYPNHPATLMWKDYERELSLYALACIAELRERGSGAMKVYEKMFTEARDLLRDTGRPPWIGNERFHAAHRSQLLAKDPDWYNLCGWTETPGSLEYFWPTKETVHGS